MENEREKCYSYKLLNVIHHFVFKIDLETFRFFLSPFCFNVMFRKRFFLGGRIDHAHHDGHAARALDETVEFSKAIDLARRRTSEENTLIIVTSDHSHTMSISGYSVCSLLLKFY